MLKSFFKLLTRCYRLALPYGQLKLFGVLAMISLNGLLQLVGVTSIFPFFALAADPGRIRLSKVGSWVVQFFPDYSNNHLLAIAGIFAIAMLFLSSIGSIVSEIIRIRYAFNLSQWLRSSLMLLYASRPYSFFLKTNSTVLIQRIWDVQAFTWSLLLPIGELLSRLVLIAFLLGAVVVVQPGIALGAIIVLGGFYFTVFSILRPKTRVNSEQFQLHNLALGKNAYQFIQGIKPVTIHGKKRYFVEKALFHSKYLGYYQSKSPIYSSGPRYFIEPIAFGGLVAIVVVMALQGRPFSDILPNLSVMAMAAYRLLPALQMVYANLVGISSNYYTLVQLEEEIESVEKETSEFEMPDAERRAVTFDHEIRVEDLSFSYQYAASPVVRDFNLSVRRNESVGIAGASGSGKSTLVDLLLGLHTPSSGQILIDGEPLCPANMTSWRTMIGYVPQDIYLMDDTIEANIALGIEASEIDQEALRSAAQGAQILNFIEKDLPQGFNTIVGERGVRLSGGQRQRIGLARALYHRPQILILDEATSALDHQTEAAVMETIHHLQGKLTIITVAHRLSTLEKCDRVITMSKGEIIQI